MTQRDWRLPTDQRESLHALHEEMPAWIEAELEARGASWRQLQRGDLELGVPPFGSSSMTPLERLQWHIMWHDPVVFAECMFLESPENDPGPSGKWRLWDYQKKSLRCPHDIVNRSASGTGKTRELVVIIPWAGATRPGKVLVVGDQDGTVAQVWRDIQFIVDANPWLRKVFPKSGRTQSPRRLMVAANGNEIIFLPTGLDGQPIRNQHAHNFVLCDECDKWTNPIIWTELWRAVKPSTRVRLYSKPTGRTDTRFIQIAQSAPLIDEVLAGRGQTSQMGGKSAASHVHWVQVHWRKPDMPTWTDEEDARLVAQYGGRQTSGYQQNVLGELGDPESSIFSRERVRAALAPHPAYRAVVMSFDEREGTVDEEVRRCNPLWASGSDDAGAQIIEWSLRHRATSVDVVSLALETARRALPHGGAGHVAGADFGYIDDPTEIVVVDMAPAAARAALRLRLERCEYPLQVEILCALVKELGISLGLGGDATGVGVAIDQLMREAIADPSDWSGFSWGRLMTVTDAATGEPALDDVGREVQVPLKERATQLLEDRIQRGLLELPTDPDFRSELENHTVMLTPSGRRRFKTTDDHLIDALRAALLRAHLVEQGGRSGLPPLDLVRVVARGSDRHPLRPGPRERRRRVTRSTRAAMRL
ncbi:MAG: hypothetical protein AAGN46_08240 [Acidobacteriota bacterium]